MITDPDNQDSLQNYYWKDDAFSQTGNQPELMRNYFDLFYKVAPMVVHGQSGTKASRFLRNSSPASRASAEDLKAFNRLLEQAKKGVV